MLYTSRGSITCTQTSFFYILLRHIYWKKHSCPFMDLFKIYYMEQVIKT